MKLRILLFLYAPLAIAVSASAGSKKCLYKSSVTHIIKHEYLKHANTGVGDCIMDGGKTRLFNKYKCHGDSCMRCVRKKDVWKMKDDCVKFYSIEKVEDHMPVPKPGCLTLQSIDTILQYEHRMSNYPCILREGRTRLFEEFCCAKHGPYDDEDGGIIKEVECFYCMKKENIDAMVKECKKNYKFGNDRDYHEHNGDGDGHGDDDDAYDDEY